MKSSDFYFDLPNNLIAQTPLENRSDSRLLCVDRESGALSHRHFYQLPELLAPGDLLVVNDSKVIPARLLGQKQDSGGAMEFLLLKELEQNVWETMVRPGKKAKIGTRFVFGEGRLSAEIIEITEGGNRIARFTHGGSSMQEVLAEIGQMPLPPYITQQLREPERYQTVYAKDLGSAAAPTAGLHFTPTLLETLKNSGIAVAKVTLHVGLGTFRPVKVEDVTEHRMHTEQYTIPPETVDIIRDTKRRGGRVIAVGTTVTRTLESVAKRNGELLSESGETDIFIYPPYDFRVIDGLITNFHLPESTLIMLVSALLGQNETMAAYRAAVEAEYRFFSFGDAMLIL